MHVTPGRVYSASRTASTFRARSGRRTAYVVKINALRLSSERLVTYERLAVYLGALASQTSPVPYPTEFTNLSELSPTQPQLHAQVCEKPQSSVSVQVLEGVTAGHF